MDNKLYMEIQSAFKDKKIVMGEGNENSKILLIGEAPGEQESKLGRPFVGKAGKNLDEFIDHLELQREDIYITNVVKYRPTRLSSKTNKPINRTPTKVEINQFKPYLFDEIVNIKPQIIVTLGNTPLQTLLGKEFKIGEVHGQKLNITINNLKFEVFPLYHPAAIIYNRSLKEIYISDLDILKKVL